TDSQGGAGRIAGIWLLGAALAGGTAAPAAERVDFSKEVLPILSENCFHCHGPDAKGRKAELRLDTHAGALAKNADGVAAVVPGKPEASSLVERIFTHDRDEVMPPPKSNRKLSARERDLLRRWVEEGARWGTHWAFAPLERPKVPENGSAHPIDALVRVRLEKERLDLQPRASRRTILRRLSLDLTGLPPTPEEVANFDADTAPDAVARTADRLLASPRYGERMAWDWLDAARYADTNGYQGDGERTMWPWRDWVVKAFNENLPYDQFTRWQIAGDLLPQASQEQVLATAFLRNHPINGEGGRIAEENRVDYVMDMAETTGTVWLGLTLACCRCHDHKYDPLLQTDYYRFFAFFNQTPVNGAGGDPQMAPRLELPQPEERERVETARGKLKDAETAVREAWNVSQERRAPWLAAVGEENSGFAEKDAKKRGEFVAALKVPEEKWSAVQRLRVEEAWAQKDPEFRKIHELREQARTALQNAEKSIVRVMVMAEQSTPRKTTVLDRGLYNAPGAEVTAGVPVALPGLPKDASANRLGLAQWLVSQENPLMARVTVNRLWQQLFGIGLVKTAEDFGVQAELPVHLELLDWLAAELRDNGWNVKALLRLIVTSDTYLQSADVPEGLAERDPQNRLLARGARFRMPSWMIRDQALAAAGLLSGRIGGRPVKPYQPAGVWEEATFGGKVYVQGKGEDLYRRSLYTFWRRIIGPTLFFDTTNRTNCAVKPLRTNTPLHALSTLNDTTYVEAARALAERAWRAAPGGGEAWIAKTFELLLARPPSKAETRLWSAAVDRHRTGFAQDPEAARKLLAVGASARDASIPEALHAALTSVCLSLLNLDETLTKE
ncbi:MAG: hypothetical protein RLZZ142_2212, partial [Verrucomicrobiota bacterium]